MIAITQAGIQVQPTTYTTAYTLKSKDKPVNFIEFYMSTGFPDRIIQEASIDLNGVVTFTNNTSSDITLYYGQVMYMAQTMA